MSITPNRHSYSYALMRAFNNNRSKLSDRGKTFYPPFKPKTLLPKYLAVCRHYVKVLYLYELYL